MEASAMGSFELLTRPVERRAAGFDRRMPFPVEVRCASDVRAGSRRYLALNLARGGLFLITLLPLQPGTLLECTFALPDDGAPLVVRARVAWSRPASPVREAPGGMGVRFVGLKKGDRKRIEALIG
ncbi:MAG: PilZ domain-containing protein [Polyangia bacterium]|jgi:uncharacterized protein (TIGR02266 family)|nr:PilZ domain-containing protein [Polyangia bacterium]